MNQLALSVFLLLASLFLAGCNQRPGVHIGDRPQRVELTDIRGKKVVLPDDFEGRVVLLRFWSVSCPSCCKAVLKAMEDLYTKYRDQGFTAISISIDSTEEVKEALDKLDDVITYPVLVDPESSSLAGYGVKVLPTTVIIDRSGLVSEKIIGETGIEMFESLLAQQL